MRWSRTDEGLYSTRFSDSWRRSPFPGSGSLTFRICRLDISNRKATKGTDIYPMPRSGMAERGGRVYVANGCFTATANKFAPITPLPMSIFSDGQLKRVQSGVIGVARRAITFSTGRR